MRKQLLTLASLTLLTPGVLFGCTQPEQGGETQTPAEAPTEQETQAMAGEGTLELRANGEDFVRQGFVTKDGWQVDFDHVYVHLADVKAYQTDPAFDPDSDKQIDPKAEETVTLAESQTVDLAEGGEDAEPILVKEVSGVPTGNYNALSWKMTPADSGPAEGHTIVMEGTAEKEGQTVDFVMQVDQPYEYRCGEYVGDQRKGILEADKSAEVEATFHFDHIFGDAEAPADDAINTGALGFDPLAELAQDGTLNVSTSELESQLSPEEYQTLQEALNSLGHVGEGHCEMMETQA
jgi:hypothetical protein